MAYLNRLSKLTEEELPAFIAGKKVRSSSHNSFVLHWTPSTLLVGRNASSRTSLIDAFELVVLQATMSLAEFRRKPNSITEAICVSWHEVWR